MNFITQSDFWQLIKDNNSVFGQLSHTLMTTMFFTALVCFFVGELTKNYSQVDKIWSIIPIVYGLITLFTVPASARILLMVSLVALWGARLTYNFARKGGYNIIPWKGEEDYRWEVLRNSPQLKGFRLVLFNLLFISFYQLFLILLFSSPLILAAKHASVPLNFLDYLAAFFMLLFLIIETTADNQLFNFHLQKKNKTERTGDYSISLQKGFMVDGFWKYVRHPNFISEQLIWVSFYFFGVAASGEWINWTLSGPILLILLFQGSSDFTEEISMKKYPEYLNYKSDTPKFIPVIFKLKTFKK